jgi:hypothetical protein
VPTQLSRALIRTHDHRHGIPADQRADPPLHEQITRHSRLLGHRNGVTEWCGDGIGQLGAIAAGSFGEPFQNVLGAINALLFDQRLQRIQPFTGLYGIIVLVHQTLPLALKSAARHDQQLSALQCR